MKKIMLALVSTTILIFIDPVQSGTLTPVTHHLSPVTPLFDRGETRKLFLDNPFSGPKYDPVTRKVYGLFSSKGVWSFASIDIETNRIKQVKPFPGITRFARGVAAVDGKQRRYFFIGEVNQKKYLYTLNIDTGDVIDRHQLTRPVYLLAYYGRTDKLYGLSKKDNIYYFISLDISLGKVAVISKLPGLSRIKGTSRKIDSQQGVFLFEGVVNDRKSLLSVHLKEGGIKIVNAHRVGINECRFHVFGKNQPKNILYSFGVGNCVVLAGYSKTCRAGFLAHFSSRFEKIEETLEEIEKQLKKRCNQKFARMDIYVAGGRIRNTASYKNALELYRILAERFAAGYKGNKIFHLGMVYNIIIKNGKIDIFF